jgi:hypothetical protein
MAKTKGKRNMRMYPIFTNGEIFRHSSEPNITGENWKTAYFSKYNLKDWEEIEKPNLSKEEAKTIYDNWLKQEEKEI